MGLIFILLWRKIAFEILGFGINLAPKKLNAV